MKTFPHVRAYRRLVLLYTVDIVVEWFAAIALMALVYERTGSTSAVAILLVAKQVVPGALVPVVGGRLEARSPSRVLVGALLLQAGCLAGLATAGPGPLFLFLAGVSGLAGGTVRSTIRASMARRLTDEELASGNAFLNVSVGVAGVVGPILAAAAVSIGGTSSALACAALLLLVLVAIAPGRACTLPIESSASDGPQNELEGAAESRPAASPLPLAGLLVLVSVIMAAFSMDDPALLDFSERALHVGVGGYATITLVWGLGITLGGVLYTRCTKLPLLRVYIAATILAAVGYIGLGVSPTIEVALAFALVGGIGNGMDWVAIVTLIQQTTPRGRESWAATRLEAIATAAPGIGILAGGFLAEALSSRAALIAPGVFAIAAILGAGLAVRLRAHLQTQAVADRTFTPSIHGGSA